MGTDAGYIVGECRAIQHRVEDWSKRNWPFVQTQPQTRDQAQPPPQQAAEPLHATRTKEGGWAVEALLSGAQFESPDTGSNVSGYREAGASCDFCQAICTTGVFHTAGLALSDGVADECLRLRVQQRRAGDARTSPASREMRGAGR
jgi:hypothetical protein